VEDGSNIANRLSRAGPQHLVKATPFAGPGFYAWWIAPAHLRDADPPIPRVPFGDDSWSLLYVGIAPNGPRSSRSVDTRVAKDHQGGSIGNSTFRQSMAAILMEHLHLRPLAGYDRSRIEDEKPLMSYIEQTCGLTTFGFPRP
jgi:GIY-YIG catalytic domain